MKEPMVSVIIPVFNHPEWLEIAINSVMNQTYSNYEIIVIDDGSTESIESLEILSNDRIRYFRNENHGVAYSRNYGIMKAVGEYVAFLDSDDFWEKDKLEKQIELMIKWNAVWSQHSYFYYSDRDQKIIKEIDTSVYDQRSKECIFCSFKVQTSCFVVKRDVLIKEKILFDESKSYGEDAVFYVQLMKKYDLLCIPDFLGYFRIRENNAGMDIYKQLDSRSVTWNDYRDDSFFLSYTSMGVRLAYRYCAMVMKFVKDKNVPRFIYKLLYVYPWLVFKIRTKRLCEKHE